MEIGLAEAGTKSTYFVHAPLPRSSPSAPRLLTTAARIEIVPPCKMDVTLFLSCHVAEGCWRYLDELRRGGMREFRMQARPCLRAGDWFSWFARISHTAAARNLAKQVAAGASR